MAKYNTASKVFKNARNTVGGVASSSLDGAMSQRKQAGITGQSAGVSVMASGVYEGVVKAVDMGSRTASVVINGVLVQNCQYFPVAFASMCGVTCNYFPEEGAHVIVLYVASEAYIMGARPTVVDMPKYYKGRAAGDTSDDTYVGGKKAFKARKRGSKGKAVVAGGFYPMGDMYPGELEFTDNMGTAVRVLYGLAQLTAGEQAKVEACLYNDMVRITSNTYVNHMAGGDTMAWTWKGKYPTIEEHFTSKQFEADGKKEESGAITSKEKGRYKSKDYQEAQSRYSDTGRWRFSRYKGFLGDLVHTFVTAPTEVVSTTMKGAVRPGLYRSWIGSDGTLMIQAAGGVHVEMTSRDITVPEVDFQWNDPEIADKVEQALDSLDKVYDKLWGDGPDWKDLGAACWQMSAYLRYITQYHSLARFKQLAASGYCRVPEPGEVDPGEPTARDKDREEACPSGKFPYLAQASFSIDPSGSITAQSNGLASIVLSNGSVQIAAAGNIELQAGNTVSISGRTMSLRSLFELEVVSVLGKVTQKAKTAFKLFCEKGRLWLKSDASDETKDYKAPIDDDDNDVELAKHAIVIEASGGSIISAAKKSNVISSEAEDNYGDIEGEYDDNNASGVIIAGRRVNLIGDTLYTHATTVASYAVNVVRKATSVFTDIGRFVYSGLFSINGKVLRGKGLQLNVGNVTSFSGFSGGTSDEVKPVKDADTRNEMVSMPEADRDECNDAVDVLKSEHDSVKYERFIDHEFKDEDDSNWRFRKWKTGSSASAWSSLKRPMVWNTINSDKVSDRSMYDEVDWLAESMPTGEHVSSDERPWPGKTGQDFNYDMSFPDVLGSGVKTKFGEGHIGGWSRMTSGVPKSFVVKSGNEDKPLVREDRK